MRRTSILLALTLTLPPLLAFAVTAPSVTIYEDAATITRVEGMKSAFKPGETVTLTITAKEKDGTMASPNRGWNIQWNTFYGPVPPSGVNLDPIMEQGFAGNAEYTSGTWTITQVLPKEPSKYFLRLSLYCSRENTPCWMGRYGMSYYFQDDRDLNFSITPAGSTAMPTQEFSPSPAPLSCNDSDGGQDLRRKGNVRVTGDAKLGGLRMEDICQNDQLAEYFCSGKRAAVSRDTCLGSCIDGACTTVTEKRPPKITRVWTTIDPLNTNATSLTYQIWIEVRKADGTLPTAAEIDQGLVTLTLADRKYPKLSAGNLSYRFDAKNQPYFSMGIGKNRSELPSTDRYILRAVQGKASARKQVTLKFLPNEKTSIRLR